MSAPAFVTGAASGIGLACVQKLLAEGAAVTGFDLAPFPRGGIDRALLAGYRHIEGDVADGAALQAAVAAAVDHGGYIARAINAAGITGALGPILDQQDDGIDALLAINVRGVFLSMKCEAAAMRTSGGGAIVNLSSVFSLAKHENMALYGATKNAVSGLTQGAAVEFARHRIRVNAVAPGPIRTPFIGDITPEIEAAVTHGIPQARLGTPDEAADVALWLCGEASSYMTGAIVVVDGGQSAKLST